MAKSGNTWFKVKRARGRKVGFLHNRVIAPASPTMDLQEVIRHGEVKRKAVKPREVRVRVGFTMSGYGAGKAARREAYFHKLGMA
jgi:hypothetical protein